MHQLYPPVPDCWSCQNSCLCLCSLQVGLLHSLLYGCPIYCLSTPQKVQNSAAKLVFKAHKHDHKPPLLQVLHWLPVQARIDYKLTTICHAVSPTVLQSNGICSYSDMSHLVLPCFQNTALTSHYIPLFYSYVCIPVLVWCMRNLYNIMTI